MARGRKKKIVPRSQSVVKRAFERRDNKRAAAIVDEYKKFLPSFKKYGRRRTFTKGERAFIAKIPKILRYTDNLYPVSNTIARNYPDQLYVPTDAHGEPIPGAPVIHAMQERNAGKDAKFRYVSNDLLFFSNGRKFLRWKLDDISVRNMKKSATTAFENFQNAFPVERLTRLAERAFKLKGVKGVFLWGSRGRCNEEFTDLRYFLTWLFEEYANYRDKDLWVNGLVLRL